MPFMPGTVGKTIILARFVPIVRTFAPFVAGMGTCPTATSPCLTSRARWPGCCCFPMRGICFGDLPVVQENLKLLILGIIVVSILPGVIEIWRHRRQAKQ